MIQIMIIPPLIKLKNSGLVNMDFLMFILTNGRKQWIKHTVASWTLNLKTQPSKKIIFDDSNSAAYFAFLKNEFGDSFQIIKIRNNKHGHGGAVNFIFEYLKRTDYEYFLELEEDWVLNRELDPEPLIKELSSDQNMIQMRIPRSPWYYHKLSYQDFILGSHINVLASKTDASFIKKNNFYLWRSNHYFWTHNPNFFKRELLYNKYPLEPVGDKNEELLFGNALFKKYPHSYAGIWAKNEYDNYVSHIGLKNIKLS